MIVGSNQPYLFPYIGYWQLINIADIYVISDSMQYIRKGYINRNFILVEEKRHMFSLEVLGARSERLINEVEVGNNSKKILKSIFHAYKKAPYFDEIYPLIENILLHDDKNLAKYIGYSIKKIVQLLDMDTKIIYLSDLQGETTLKAQDRTIDICTRLDANQYINAIGGQELYSKECFKEENIELNFLQTELVEYTQFKNEFVPYLSIIDVMMFNSKEAVQNMLNSYKLV